MPRGSSLAALALALALAAPAGALCPEQCRCWPRGSDCSRSRLDAVPIFLDPRLHELRLRGNNISSVEDALGFYPNLRQLDLAENTLTSLGRRQLAMQLQLRRLQLQHNRVAELLRDSLEGLGRLAHLDLAGNRLSRLDAGVFRWTGRLRTLVLADNRIGVVSRDAFESLAELAELDLSRNRLRHVPSEAFRHLVGLRVLKLDGNGLQEVPFHAFFVLRSLRSLSLARNAIARIHAEAFAELYGLRALDVSFNRLEVFPAAALALPQLEELDAGGNRFPALRAHHVDSLRRLRVVRLCHSRALAAIGGRVFSNSPLLEEVHVCENPRLAWFPRSVVEPLPLLAVLNLGGNGLAVLENMTLPLRHVELFNASDNPLACNCSARWLWELPDRVANASAVWPVVCADSGRPLAALDAAELGCGGWLAPLLVAAAAFAAAFCAALAALLLLRRRRRSADKAGRVGARAAVGVDAATRPRLVPPGAGTRREPAAGGQRFTLLDDDHFGDRFGDLRGGAGDYGGDYRGGYRGGYAVKAPSVVV